MSDEHTTASQEDAPAAPVASHQQRDHHHSHHHSHYALPVDIKTFAQNLQDSIADGDVARIYGLYDSAFNQLTEKYFKQNSWPAYEFLGADESDVAFRILYKELYFRHIYAKVREGPSIEQRFESWHNYCDLFELLDTNPNICLPNQWLWDILDEFIYQFQSFYQFRAKTKAKTENDIQMLQGNPQVWNILRVLRYLEDLQRKSGVVNLLKAGDNISSVSAMLGLFSMICQLRVHCLLGDYRLALKSIDPIDMNKQNLLTCVPASYVTLCYYVGFAYMMSRRYQDAVRTFSHILLCISRIKQSHSRSYQYEQILKKNEQMCALLAILLSINPQHVDEGILQQLREKVGDKLARLQACDETCFSDLFGFASPKFITPSEPNYACPTGSNQDALRLQSRMFLEELRQQALLPTLRSYLKLYTTIGVQKLAGFMECDEEAVRHLLMSLKHKTHGLQWQTGSALNGRLASCSDIDFFVDKDMIHIADTKVERRYGEYFCQQLEQLQTFAKIL